MKVDKINQLRQAAVGLREGIIKTKGAGLQSLSEFPSGACGNASPLLAQYFHDLGLGEWEYVSGIRSCDQHSHAWLEKDGWIVDITADQFDDVDQEVLLTKDELGTRNLNY
jgi:hypothetical protein